MDQARKKELMKPVLLIAVSSALYMGLMFFDSDTKTEVAKVPPKDGKSTNAVISPNIPVKPQNNSEPIKTIPETAINTSPGTLSSLPNPFSPLPTGSNSNPGMAMQTSPPLRNLPGLPGVINGSHSGSFMERMVVKAIFYGGNSVAIIGNANDEMVVRAGDETKWGTVSEIRSDSIVVNGKRFRLADSESIESSTPGQVAPIPTLPIIGRNGGI